MTRIVENLEDVNEKYFSVEVKDGFDKFELGDTGIEIEMRPRTGVGKYTNFSNHVEVIGRTEGAKYPIGTHLWVANTVVDSKFIGDEHFGEHEDKPIYHFKDGGVAFVGADITTAYSEHWVLGKTKEHKIEEKNGITLYNAENPNILEVVNSNEDDIPAGSEIEYIHGRRVEFWQKEVQYWAVMKTRVASVDGEPYGKFYKMDEFEELEYEQNGILMTGNKAAQIKYDCIPAKHQKLARLLNPKLPFHNKVALVYQTKSRARYAEHIILLVESGDIIMNFKLFKGKVIS